MTLDDIIRRLVEGGGDGGFDPYKQPGMGMGYGAVYGAGAATPPPDLSGYRGPSRGLPQMPPQPGMLGGGTSGGYGPAQGANSLEAVLRLIATLLPTDPTRLR